MLSGVTLPLSPALPPPGGSPQPRPPAAKAARWKGHAPHVTTGIEAAATTHCHPVNCQAGTIDRIAARMPRGAETMRRRSMSAAWARVPSPTWGAGAEAGVKPGAHSKGVVPVFDMKCFDTRDSSISADSHVASRRVSAP